MSLRGACFWLSATGGAWTLVGYPAFLTMRPRRPWKRGEARPTVTIIVPTYRELDTLPVKLRALAQLDYPAEKLRVVVSVDGDPRLADVARAAYPQADVVCLPERSGKAAAIRAALPGTRSEILVLTDANNVLTPGSLGAAVRHFADPDIWAVAGQRCETGSAYDRYENLVRRLEARSGSVAAMSGDFIAVRRERMPAIPEGIVNEDLWLLCDLVRRGGRVVYEPLAASTEPSLRVTAEIARRSRIGAGRMMLLDELRGLPAGFAMRLVSHKYGRLALPFLLLCSAASSIALGRRQPYRMVALLQLGFYLTAALGAAGVEPPGPAGLLTRAARQFTVGNVAIGLGVMRAGRGRQDVRWNAVR